MKIIIRESAYADLERIYAWIAQDSPRNAVSIVRRIDAAIEDTPAFFPFMGRRGKAPGTRGGSFMASIRHRLPVDEERDGLTVAAIFHGAQDR